MSGQVLSLLRERGRLRILVPPHRPAFYNEPIGSYPSPLEMDTMELRLEADRPTEEVAVIVFCYRGLNSHPVTVTYQLLRLEDQLPVIGFCSIRDRLQDGRAQAH